MKEVGHIDLCKQILAAMPASRNKAHKRIFVYHCFRVFLLHKQIIELWLQTPILINWSTQIKYFKTWRCPGLGFVVQLSKSRGDTALTVRLQESSARLEYSDLFSPFAQVTASMTLTVFLVLQAISLFLSKEDNTFDRQVYVFGNWPASTELSIWRISGLSS